MRNINKTKKSRKVKGSQHVKNSHQESVKLADGVRGASYWLRLWGEIEGLKIRVSQSLKQLFNASSSREMRVQPVKRVHIKRWKTARPPYLIGLSALIITTLFTNCSSTVPHANQLQVTQANTIRADNNYQTMIGDSRIISAENLWAYNRHSIGFPMVKISDLRTVNQQKLDSLMDLHLVISNRINHFNMNEGENWESFKTALNQDIDAMKKTLNDSTAISKTVIN
jgi:hypothetical protein